MPIDPEKLLKLEIPALSVRYDNRDAMLYALGVGFGSNPVDANELRFVYEKNLRVVPTMAAVIGWDRSWIPRTGINWLKVVHGEEHLTLHRPLPAAAEVTAISRVSELVDKGPDKGAIMVMETVVHDKNGEKLFTRSSSFFARADGGFGGSRESRTGLHPIPERSPDAVVALVTYPNQALLYRLSGDRNPLHSDPDVARASGFARPILHGLCSYGHACRTILATYCDYDPTRIKDFNVRFTSPVLPGAALKVEMWKDSEVVSYRVINVDTGRTALNNGRATLHI